MSSINSKNQFTQLPHAAFILNTIPKNPLEFIRSELDKVKTAIFRQTLNLEKTTIRLLPNSYGIDLYIRQLESALTQTLYYDELMKRSIKIMDRIHAGKEIIIKKNFAGDQAPNFYNRLYKALEKISRLEIGQKLLYGLLEGYRKAPLTIEYRDNKFQFVEESGDKILVSSGLTTLCQLENSSHGFGQTSFTCSLAHEMIHALHAIEVGSLKR